MREHVAGKTLEIEGKTIRCPGLPLFVVKSLGTTLTIESDRSVAHSVFNAACGAFRQLWRLDAKGTWQLMRQVRNGKEQGNEQKSK